jgi:hypothetical protein
MRKEVMLTAPRSTWTQPGCASCHYSGGSIVVLVRELTLKQDTASEKAYTQLVNIAHRRQRATMGPRY